MLRILVALTVGSLFACGAPLLGQSEGSPTPLCEYGSRQSLGPVVNSPGFDGSPTVSADETELFFTSGREGQQDLFVSTRANRNAAWSKPVNVGKVVNDQVGDDFSPRLSNDGLELYFASNRKGGFGKADMYVVKRASRKQPWGSATNLGQLLNTQAFEAFPTPSADGKLLYFNRSTTFDSQDSDIWVATRTSPAEKWSTPQRLPSKINSQRAEFSPSISSDGKKLYFASERSGSIEVYVSTRQDGTREWGPPQNVGENINIPRGMTLAPFILSDQRSLYLMSAQPKASADEGCTPRTCFEQLDLYVASVNCH
jgi:Tol biopolymer transport system component